MNQICADVHFGTLLAHDVGTVEPIADFCFIQYIHLYFLVLS